MEEDDDDDGDEFIFTAVLTIALMVRTVTWLPSSSMSTQSTVLPCSQNSSAS
jgi:hypothetical protein